MHLTVHQSICIHMLKVNSVSNASILQIGSAGAIRSNAELYNTGGFTQPAEEAESISVQQTLVPLSPQ
ncbi:spore germination protein GerPB [Virgibacillus senegalensis]|uniref:spore germination protein GerPB n=1 Tax=Virgibacillus senegalensis TaxID=1499679 RepID=UPI00069FD0D4|nr:spore germination protein GerPB [Virgibacillus senegalensis]